MSSPAFQIAHLSLANTTLLRSNLLLTGLGQTLQQDYQQALTAQQASAPIFATQVNGPGVYSATDGKKYSVPLARVGLRANMPQTPAISFKSDGKSWTLLITIELVTPPGSDSSATPLLMDNYRVEIHPGDQSPPLTFAKVTPLQAPDSSIGVVGLLKVESVVDETFALSILRDKPGAHLLVTGSLSYRYQFVSREINPNWVPPDDPTDHSHQRNPSRFQMPFAGTEMRLDEPVARLNIGDAFKHDLSTRFDPGASVFHLPPPQFINVVVVSGQTTDQSLAANVATHFPSDARDYKPIYAQILGVGSDGTVWSQETGQGYSRPSAGSDGYYVLPDAFRLALDATTDLPAMSLFLVSTPSKQAGGPVSYSVRVRLAIAPLMDGSRMERMRAAIRKAENIPYAHLSIGGYSSAAFVPSAMFSMLPGFDSGILGDTGGSTQIDATNGFELVLNCSLEFYTLLTKLLCSPDGLQGTVQLQVVTSHVDGTPPLETTLRVSVPVVLSFLGPSPVQPGVHINPANPGDPAANSIPVSISNPLPVPLKIAGIFPTLLEDDPDLQMTTGSAILVPSLDSLTLDAGATALVTMNLDGGKFLPPYTALSTTFGTTTPTFDPAAVLNHYHQLTSGATIAASAHFECYLLKHVDQIPPSLANLLGMQIEVQHGSNAVINVPLTRDTPSADVSIPYSFEQLLAGISLDQPTFQYRAKCLYPDHTGPFSDWIPNTGSNVLVTPV